MFCTSGILYLAAGKPMNYEEGMQQKVNYIFQNVTLLLYELPALKLGTEKDMVVLDANIYIAPLACTLAATIWSVLIGLVLNMVYRNKAVAVSTFWKKVFVLNLSLSSFWFFAWCCMSLHFMTEGYYSDNISVFHRFLVWVEFVFFLPTSLIPDLIAHKWLAFGTESTTEYNNLYLVSRTASAFSAPVWSIVLVWLSRYLPGRKKREAKKAVR